MDRLFDNANHQAQQLDENPEEKFNALQKYIQDPLSLKVLDGSLKEDKKIVADLDAGKNLIFR